MIGKYKNGKITYTTPRYAYLSGGNWEKGFSSVGHTGGETVEYDIIKTKIKLKEGEIYNFEVVKNKAKIISIL